MKYFIQLFETIDFFLNEYNYFSFSEKLDYTSQNKLSSFVFGFKWTIIF